MAVMTQSFLNFRAAALTAAVFLIGTAAQAAAPKLSHQIDVASTQISLGHKLVNAICLAEAGITPLQQVETITQIRDTVQHTLTAMIDGNEDLGITAETDSTTLTHLSSVQKVWAPLRDQVDQYLSGTPFTTKQVTKLSFKADSLQKLWSNIIARYELKNTVHNGQDGLDRTRQLKAASNQDVLIQKSAKLACLIHLNGGPETAKYQTEQLQETLPMVETATFGLAFSDPRMQLVMPPSDAIQEVNFMNWQDWVGASLLFEAALAGTLATTDLHDLTSNVNFLSQSYHTAMRLYADL